MDFTRDGMIAGMSVGGAPLGGPVAAAVTSASLDLSTTQTSQLELTISDPTLTLIGGSYLGKRTRVKWGGLDLEVAVRGTTEVAGNPALAVTLRAHGVQVLKRRWGAKVWRGQSYSTWLRSECRVAGLAFHGETSPKLKQIVRAKTESSWDVAVRAGRELGYLVFEASGGIYFARPTWLVAHLPRVDLKWPTQGHLLGFPSIRDSDDDGTVGRSGSLSISYDQVDRFLPGRGTKLSGLGAYSGTYQVTGLRMTLDGVSAGDVSIATPVNPAPEPPTTSADESGRSTTRSSAASMSYRGIKVAGGPRSAEAFTSWALRQSGDRYIFGAEATLSDPDPSRWDCSELVQWAAHRVYLTMPDGSGAQRAFCRSKGTLISISKARNTRGALLFGNGHVAISLGNGSTIEAANSRLGVRQLSSAGRPWVAAGLVPGMNY